MLLQNIQFINILFYKFCFHLPDFQVPLPAKINDNLPCIFDSPNHSVAI